jgi:hypothetical protein
MLRRHCRDQKQRRHILVSTFGLFILDLEDFKVLRRAKCLGSFAPAHQQAHVALKAGGLDCISNIELDSYPRVS